MTVDEARDVIKQTIPVTRFLEGTNIANYYICPLCGSGHGPHRTPALRVYPETNTFSCFSCNTAGDVIKLYRMITKTGYMESVRQLAGLAGIRIDGAPEPDGARMAVPPVRKQERPVPHKDYTKFIDTAHRNVWMTGYFRSRGFTEEMINRFRLGFKPDYGVYSIKDGAYTRGTVPAVIIPYNRKNTYFIARDVENKRYLKPSYKRAGPEPVYNEAALRMDRPVFVCESPIDAISIMQCGGMAVATGGTGTNKLMAAVRKNRPERPLILALDNDDMGIEASRKLAAALAAERIPFTTADFSRDRFPRYVPLKDANDLLMADPLLLADDTARIEARASSLS